MNITLRNRIDRVVSIIEDFHASQIRYVEQKVDALATDGDEGRSKLR